MASFPEAARERDLQRYFRPWLDAQNLVHSADGRAKGLTYEGYQPENSRDKALTAFAQLAALRLNVRRAMVSLIDTNRQYILAEATKTLSLFSRGADEPEDEVWLGNTIIARHDAVCHHTFNSTYTAQDDGGETYATHALVISDCRLDARFAHRDYVKGEPGVRFYAGVPITTKAGYQIGVYAVSDDSPRDGLSTAEVRFMEDVAAAVMEHLELAKDKDDRNKGERMVRGLTEFIERSSVQEARNEVGSRLTTMEKQTENARLDALEEEDQASGAALASRPTPRKRTTERESETSRIFHRAARIIRQTTDADGVVFFDTSAAGITGHVYENWSPVASSDESVNPSTTDFDTADSAATSKRRHPRERASRPGASWQDPSIETRDFGATAPPVHESKACPVAGLSLRGADPSFSEQILTFTEASMERYIRKYPYGKFFTFGDDGLGINSSDERSEKSETDLSDNRTISETKVRKPRKRRERFVPTELLTVLPNVRSLIFLPLWDSASERWVAGGFIWTTTPGRLMNPEHELPYLKAFGNSITSEVARSSAQKSDRAKTTFIASISHELRSPLHGILGSVEFLQDTVSSTYQESLITSIETCGKTLLDTIDHVLDYAKINKLRDASSRRKQRAEGRNKRLPADNSILGVTTDFSLSQLVEEVCETVCAGHTFRKTHKAHNNVFHDQGGRSEGDGMGKDNAGNELMTNKVDGQEQVAVTLNIAPSVNWMVRSQPGALRRIVMNLLGNALKYTHDGFITVSLLQEIDPAGGLEFILSVEDSGKGMSTEYQRTKMFAPFSQEDPFSSGTGLGLSIVKQIVESLKGDIEVKSAVNAGTRIRIHLRLPGGQNDQARNSQMQLQTPISLKGKQASIKFSSDKRGGPDGGKFAESMRQACHGFEIKTSATFDLLNAPNFLLSDPASLQAILTHQTASLAASPVIAVLCLCVDPAEKAAVDLDISKQIVALGWIVEVIYQPCGPRKLARMLQDLEIRIEQAKREYAFNHTSIPRPAFDPKLLVHRTMSAPVRDPNTTPHTISSALETLSSIGIQLPPIGPNPLSQPFNQSSPATTPSFTSANPPRVLLVDDNSINLKLLTVFAKRQKLPYSEATNGLIALDEYKSKAFASNPPTKPFDFILMDLSMPVMDGLESTRQIRKFETEKGLNRSTIVALTGLASAQDQQDALDAGVDLYLVKPVKFKDVERLFGVQR